MRNQYASIIIDISHEALDKVFQYRVPFSLCGKIKAGSRVRVPFGRGNHEKEGYVISLESEAQYPPEKIKEIIGIVEESISVESQLIEMASFLRHVYGSSMNQALKTVMPVKRKIKHRKKVMISLALSSEQAAELLTLWEKRHYKARIRLLRLLMNNVPDAVSKEEAVKESGLPWKELCKLQEQNILQMSETVEYRKVFSGLERKKPIPLNEEQEQIVCDFKKEYLEEIRKVYLLYGVTGSGKTEVYLALIEQVIALGKQVIVLIPEISLTYQTVRRFYERFGEQIAVLHSRMSQGERSDSYERILKGDAKIVIGARSALFAPMNQLGLIIMDEEHDGAYKSDTTPKYHARECAIFRAKQMNASVVLGSATPSLESFTYAKEGKYTLWTLKQRAGQASMPTVSIVDLKEEFKQGNRSMFSVELRKKMEERLQKKEQIMLFINRRGYAGFVSCRSCGQVMTCPHCDVSMTYHRNGQLICHYCGYQIPYSRQCPVCQSPHVAAFGLGTEKVEAALKKEFPEARVLRMDMDTTKRKDAHQNILKEFSQGNADILIGTQMIVKGHDYANVTLVGVLAADLSLHSQNYRSGEQTFQLLCQAAGRAGRGEKPGEVVIQTYSPEHYAIVSAAEHSYEKFYESEYAFRQIMAYPPCAHLLVILVQSGDENQCALAMQRLQKMITISQEKEQDPIRILNPGKASLAKLKDIYRQVLYLKHKDEERLFDLKDRLQAATEEHPLFAGITIQYDFDPMNSY